MAWHTGIGVSPEEQFLNIEAKLAPLAASTKEHDNRLQELIRAADEHMAKMTQLGRKIDELERRWQDWLQTLHKK